MRAISKTYKRCVAFLGAPPLQWVRTYICKVIFSAMSNVCYSVLSTGTALPQSVLLYLAAAADTVSGWD